MSPATWRLAYDVASTLAWVALLGLCYYNWRRAGRLRQRYETISQHLDKHLETATSHVSDLISRHITGDTSLYDAVRAAHEQDGHPVLICCKIKKPDGRERELWASIEPAEPDPVLREQAKQQFKAHLS